MSLEAIARELYNALVEARPYVYNRAAPEGVTSDDWRAATAAGVLERVDAALADAGELLSGVTS